MKRILTAILLCVTILISGCEKDDGPLIEESGVCLVYVNGIFVKTELDEMPTYLDGGEDGFNMAILKAVSYPAEARENDIQGLCRVQYEITESGEVENMLVIEDPGGGIGEETVQTLTDVTSGISFSPTILDGSPVRVRKEFRLRFKLQ